ncbi:MAG TPA: hypothetical protein VGM18_04830 [Candidatus Sulfotelmatobacter sp.]|jgi:hypothetical protein
MSKTAKELGLILGGIALGGVGALAYYGLLSFGIGPATFSTMLGIGLSSALSGIGLALRPPLQPVGAANSISVNSGISPRRVIYGQFQTAGVLTYASFPGSQNQSTTSQFLHLVYTLTGHEITSFDAVTVDGFVYNFGSDILQDSSLPDTPWQIHPDAFPTINDFYWQHMMFEFDAGRPADGAQPFPNLANADSAWTSACLQRGCAKVHVILRADSGLTALYPSGQIPNIQFLVTGKKIVDPRIVTAWAPSTNYPPYDYTIDNNGYIWFQQANPFITPSSGLTRPNFEALSGTAGATLADNTCVWFNTGWPVAAVYNGTTAPPSLAQGPWGTPAILVNDGWVAGETYGSGAVDLVVIEAPVGYLQMLTGAGTGAASHPVFATTRGTTTTDGTLTWTCLGRSTHAINPSNNALCANDYLQDSFNGIGAAAATIDTASVIASANVCEEQELIIWNADNTVVYENLYTCNGMFDHSSTRGDVLSALCASMAGWAIPPGDLWHIFAGSYITPTLSFGDDDLRAGLKADFRLSRREVANGIKGTYTPAFLPASPAAAISLTSVPGTWQSQSFPPYQANGLAGKPNFLNTEDDGQVIWQDVHFEFTTSVWTAQRLAKIALMRLRFQQTLTLQFKLTAFQLEAGDTFYFTHARWDINGGVFEASQCSLTFDSDKDGMPIVGVDVVARQVDPSIYSFTPPSSSTDYGEYSPFGVTGVMTGVE